MESRTKALLDVKISLDFFDCENNVDGGLDGGLFFLGRLFQGFWTWGCSGLADQRIQIYGQLIRLTILRFNTQKSKFLQRISITFDLKKRHAIWNIVYSICIEIATCACGLDPGIATQFQGIFWKKIDLSYQGQLKIALWRFTIADTITTWA